RAGSPKSTIRHIRSASISGKTTKNAVRAIAFISPGRSSRNNAASANVPDASESRKVSAVIHPCQGGTLVKMRGAAAVSERMIQQRCGDDGDREQSCESRAKVVAAQVELRSLRFTRQSVALGTVEEKKKSVPRGIRSRG